jgi:diguanylate cyclase (GGDEF)-like protein/PAS domain S-box-containing protein
MEKTSQKFALSARQIIDHINQGVLITDTHGRIMAVNETFCHVTGYNSDEVIGKNPRLLQSKKHTGGYYKRMWNALLKSGYWTGEITNRKKNGDLYTERLTITGIREKGGKVSHYMGVFKDITEQKEAEETIRHLAFYDSLTDLPNRTLFRDRLKQAITQAQRNKQILAVLFLDLDRVKIINDTLGHPMGDRLIKGVGNRIRKCLREVDTVARLSGDEFMIVLPGIKGVDDIVKICEKIHESLKPPFYFEGHELFTTASIGISIYPYDSNDPETLLRHADTAMYRAKRKGRNNYQFFTSSMKDEDLEELALGHDLRRALDRDEFIIYYQPQINIRTGKIFGMEALVRWKHKEMGIIYPGQFIPWAEESGLIIPLGEWVLRTACEQTYKWMNNGMPRLRLAVNLSAQQFNQRDLVKVVSQILADTKLPSDCLELEITESAVIENLEYAQNTPHELKALGIRLAVDDFGTGYSSLTYLKKLPVNTLKMDQSFVRDLTQNPDDAAIASAVITMGHGLDLNVMAEGVETENQFKFLKDHNCDGIQGHLFSQAIPPKEFEKLVKEKGKYQEELLFSV